MEHKLSKAQQEAKAYVERHQLEKVVGQMLNALVHAKDPSPIVFMIKHLATLSTPQELAEAGISINMPTQARESIIQEKQPPVEEQEQAPICPEFTGSPNSLAYKYWNNDLWRQIYDKKTSNGFTAVSCINPDSKAKFGIVAKDGECYRAFDYLFKNVIEDYYGKDLKYKDGTDADLPSHDPTSEFVQNLRIKISRNIKGQKMVPGMNDDDRAKLEQTLRPVLQKIEGRYLDMESATDVDKEELSLYFPAEPGKAIGDYYFSAQNWPQGRAVLICPNKSYIWVNAKEHIEIVVIGYGSELQSAWNRAHELLSLLQQDLEFEFDDDYGYLNSVVSEIGTGTNISAFIQFPLIAKHPNLENWAIEHELDLKKRDDGKSIVIFEKPRIGKSSAEIVTDFNRTIKEAIDWEKELQILFYPKIEGDLRNYMSEDIWNNFKNSSTSDGFSFYRHISASIENPDNSFTLCSKESYSTYSSIISSLCQSFYNLTDLTHQKDLTVPDLEEPDNDGKYIKSVRLTAYRNIAGFPFTPALSTSQRENIENSLRSVLSQLSDDLAVDYTPITEINKSETKMLISKRELFAKPEGGRDGDWPGYRGIFRNSSGDLIAWANATEHLTVISKSQSSQVIPRVKNLVDTLTQIEANLEMWTDEQYGYLASTLLNIGTALELTAVISLSNAPLNDRFDTFCSENNLAYAREGDNLEISYNKKFGVSESQSFAEFVNGLKNLVSWEDQLSQS